MYRKFHFDRWWRVGGGWTTELSERMLNHPISGTVGAGLPNRYLPITPWLPRGTLEKV